MERSCMVVIALLFVKRARCESNTTEVEGDERSGSDGVLFWVLNGYGVKATDIVINLVVVTLAVWMVVLNVLVLHTLLVLKSASSREPADLFICSLALADALNGVILLYHTTYNMTNFQIFHECLFRMGMIQVTNVSSVLHLVALTADRFLKIIFPYRYNSACHPRAVVGVSVTLWAAAIVIGLLPLMGWNTNKRPALVHNPKDPVCSFFGIHPQSYLIFIIFWFWLAFLSMTVMYIFIFRVALHHARAIAAQEQSGVKKGSDSDRRNLRVAKTVVVILGTYVFCWLPTGTVIMLDLAGHFHGWTNVEKGNLLLYVSGVAFINSIINPIIYAVKISAVRTRFRQVFCRKPPQVNAFDASTLDGTDVQQRRQRMTQAWTTQATYDEV